MHRVGQEVVWIGSTNYLRDYPRTWLYQPKKDTVYHVRGIDHFEGKYGLYLDELKNPHCRCDLGEEVSYMSKEFVSLEHILMDIEISVLLEEPITI